MEGVPFVNEEGKTDAIFIDGEEIIYLSDLADLDSFDNCGFFSKLKKAVKKTVEAVTIVSARTAVYAIGVATVCGVVAVTAASAVTSGGLTLPVGLPAAFATAGLVMAKTAVIASAIVAGGVIVDAGIDAMPKVYANDNINSEPIKEVSRDGVNSQTIR